MAAKRPHYEIDLHIEEARARVKYADVGPDVDVTVFESDHADIKIAAKGKWIIKDGCKIFRVTINGSDQDWPTDVLDLQLQQLEKDA